MFCMNFKYVTVRKNLRRFPRRSVRILTIVKRSYLVFSYRSRSCLSGLIIIIIIRVNRERGGNKVMPSQLRNWDGKRGKVARVYLHL